jgi:hypothetical protein
VQQQQPVTHIPFQVGKLFSVCNFPFAAQKFRQLQVIGVGKVRAVGIFYNLFGKVCRFVVQFQPV